ncbi:MAG TPA: Hsp70 family protein [Pseudonocardiaceae bacterium]|jgi:molecular chaperone DnaK (HSP70)|nr:Hsp70 family protein [Pseudonocardiaceae bacterium]
MPYVLGIDVGTNHTTAAISRLDEPAADAVEIVRLSRSRALSSVLHLAEDGSIAVGDAAEQWAAGQPERVARGFVRRVGDDVPVLLAGEQYSAQELTAMLVRWVLDRVVAQEGEPPRHVVLTHPAGWGGYRRGLLHQELRVQGVGEVTLLPEPVAVGEQRAAEVDIEAGATLAVYSLGDGVFSASVIRKVASGAFLLLTRTESADTLGGARFTDLLLGQVRGSLGAPLPDLDLADPQARVAMYRFRQACVQAKEQLSTAPEVVVPVALPGVQQQVRVNRGSFDELIRTTVTCTVDLLLRTVRAAALAPAQIDAVMLVGGSTRIPLIPELVSAGLASKDTVIVLDDAPELTPVKGAALAARRLATGEPSPIAERSSGSLVVAEDDDSPIQLPRARDEPDDFDAPPPRPAVDIPPLDLPEPRTVSSLVPWVSPGVLGVIVAVVAVAGIVLTFMIEGGATKTAPLTSSGGGGQAVHSTSYQPSQLTTSSQGGGN